MHYNGVIISINVNEMLYMYLLEPGEIFQFLFECNNSYIHCQIHPGYTVLLYHYFRFHPDDKLSIYFDDTSQYQLTDTWPFFCNFFSDWIMFNVLVCFLIYIKLFAFSNFITNFISNFIFFFLFCLAPASWLSL